MGQVQTKKTTIIKTDTADPIIPNNFVYRSNMPIMYTENYLSCLSTSSVFFGTRHIVAILIFMLIMWLCGISIYLLRRLLRKLSHHTSHLCLSHFFQTIITSIYY